MDVDLEGTNSGMGLVATASVRTTVDCHVKLHPDRSRWKSLQLTMWDHLNTGISCGRGLSEKSEGAHKRLMY